MNRDYHGVEANTPTTIVTGTFSLNMLPINDHSMQLNITRLNLDEFRYDVLQARNDSDQVLLEAIYRADFAKMLRPDGATLLAIPPKCDRVPACALAGCAVQRADD